MKRFALLLGLLTACSKDGPTGGDGGVQPVVGAYCTVDKVNTAVAYGDDWNVTIFWNETTYRYVTGTDGIVRQQEVRACRTRTCYIIGGVSLMDAAGAIAYCQQH